VNGIASNATPLIYLAKAGKINLLKKVFGEVFIPQEVKTEVVDKGKRLGQKDAYIIEAAITEGWLKVLNAKPIKIPIKLEQGETATIALAKNLKLKEVLIDEVSARTAARLMNLKPRGTIFVLLKVLEKNEIDLNELLETLNSLIKHGFRLKEEVYLEAVREAGRIAAET
jgi:predicted nucleic acid-binding protein